VAMPAALAAASSSIAGTGPRCSSLRAMPKSGTSTGDGGYDYRLSVALWLRGLFAGNPDVHPIAHTPATPIRWSALSLE
jgi:hypothetical protein